MNKEIAGVLAVALLATGASSAWAKDKEKDKAQAKDKQTHSSQGDRTGSSGIGALGVTWE